jgi:hypothetical protein
MATSTVKRRVRPEFLSPVWLAEEFAEIEKKDCRVVEVRLRSAPSWFKEFGGPSGTVWNAKVVVDRRMPADRVVFRHEEPLAPVVPVKVRKKTVRRR